MFTFFCLWGLLRHRRHRVLSEYTARVAAFKRHPRRDADSSAKVAPTALAAATATAVVKGTAPVISPNPLAVVTMPPSTAAATTLPSTAAWAARVESSADLPNAKGDAVKAGGGGAAPPEAVGEQSPWQRFVEFLMPGAYSLGMGLLGSEVPATHDATKQGGDAAAPSAAAAPLPLQTTLQSAATMSPSLIRVWGEKPLSP